MKKTTQEVLALNLQRYLDAANMTQTDLAEALGVSSSAVSLWVLGKNAPRASMVDKICKVLRISRAELILDTDVASMDTARFKSISLYNPIYSDKNFFADSNIERMIAVDQSVIADFGIIVASYSMTDAGIEPGDIAFFKKDYKFVDGRIYAMWLIDNESVILKKVYARDNQYILVSENSNMAPLVIDNNTAFVIGELCGMYKEWKWV